MTTYRRRLVSGCRPCGVRLDPGVLRGARAGRRLQAPSSLSSVSSARTDAGALHVSVALPADGRDVLLLLRLDGGGGAACGLLRLRLHASTGVGAQGGARVGGREAGTQVS